MLKSILGALGCLPCVYLFWSSSDATMTGRPKETDTEETTRCTKDACSSKRLVLPACRASDPGLVDLLASLLNVIQDGSKMLMDMYAACLFLRMGAHFVRLTLACRAAVDSIIIRKGRPPSHVAQRNRQLEEFMLQNYPFGRSMGSSRGKFRRKALEAYRVALSGFFSAFNGATFDEYYDCDQPFDLEVLKRRRSDALVKVFLRSQPQAPNEGKWTKLGPAFDFFLLSDAYNILTPLASIAFGRMVFQSRSGPNHTTPKLLCLEILFKSRRRNHIFRLLWVST